MKHIPIAYQGMQAPFNGSQRCRADVSDDVVIWGGSIVGGGIKKGKGKGLSDLQTADCTSHCPSREAILPQSSITGGDGGGAAVM